MAVTRKTYDEKLKRKVLDAVKNREGETVGEIAARHGIRPGLIYAWQRTAEGRPDYTPKRTKALVNGARKAIAKRGVHGWLTFALHELNQPRPNVEVARSYVVLARHELAQEESDG